MTTYVYILEERCEYEESDLLGVFTSRPAAEHAAQKQCDKAASRGYRSILEIRQRPLAWKHARGGSYADYGFGISFVVTKMRVQG